MTRHPQIALAALLWTCGALAACQFVAGLDGLHEIGSGGAGGSATTTSGSGKGGAASSSSGVMQGSTGPGVTSSTASTGSTGGQGGGDAGCGDTQSAAKNCGACGHDCLGGSCTSGVCQPVQLVGGGALGESNLTGFAVAKGVTGVATAVFWLFGGTGTNDGQVFRRSLDASPNTTSVAMACAPAAIAAGAASVYWVNAGGCPMPGLNGEVWSANLDGSGAALLVGNQATPVAIAAGVAGFAWLNAGDQTLKLVPSGATAAIVTVLGSAPLAIAADPMWINWTQTDGQVLRELWDGSGMKIVGAAQMSPDSIAPPPSGAPGPYWTETGAGNVRYFGTTGTMLLDKAEQSPRGITTDDASAYWADTTAGSVLTAPMGGGTVATVIGQQSAPIAVLVDAVSVFWMNSAQGKGTAILRLAR